MPDNVKGKLVVTNRTAKEDVALVKELDVKYLVTTTPVYDGRLFRTNTMEADMVAVLEKKS